MSLPTVHAGDDAIYTPARGEPVRVRVMKHTAKRVTVALWTVVNHSSVDVKFASQHMVLRHVSAARLAKVPGGGLLDADERA